MSRTTFRTAFVLILVLAVSFAFLAVAWPFLIPLLLGALLAGLCDPLYRLGHATVRRTQVARGWDNASDSFCSDRWASERVCRSGRKAGVGSKQPGPAVGAGAFRCGERFQRARLAGTAFSGARALRSRTGPDRRQRGSVGQSNRHISRRGRDPAHREHRHFSAQPLRHALRHVLFPPRRRRHSGENLILHTAQPRR